MTTAALPPSPQANAQLKVVRESHERSSREVEAAAAKAAEQRCQVAELQQTVDQGREAYALVDSELEVRPRNPRTHPRPITVGAAVPKSLPPATRRLRDGVDLAVWDMMITREASLLRT